MATLLGTATLTTEFTSTFDDVRVVTNDSTRVTSTAFKRPIAASILDPGSIPAGAGQTDERPLFKAQSDKFLDSGYCEDDYITGDSESVNIIDGVIYCAYDFLEVGQISNVANIQIQLSVQSTVGSGSDRGNIRVQWAENGKTTVTPLSAAGPTTITDGEITTLNFTITPDGTQWDGVGMGRNPLLRINFQEGGASKSGCFLFSAKVKANYTGRTRFTTGYRTPSSSTGGVFDNDINPYVSGNQSGAMVTSTGYGFAIPSFNTVNGVALRFGAVGTERNANQIWGPGNFRFKDAVGGTLVTQDGFFVGSGVILDGVEGSHATLYSGVDNNNTMGLTATEANNTNLTLESRYLITSGTSENLKQPFVADVNLAHIGPQLSGDVAFNTVSTVTATPSLIHGFTADQIDDLTGTVTLTALGGFLLEGAPQTQASAITTNVGTTGRIRTGFTVAMSAQFTVPTIVGAINDLTGSTIIFPTATVVVSAAVERTTPATSNTAFTVAPGTAIGRIRTNHTSALPITATMPTITDVLLIKAPALTQIFTTGTQTRTYVIPEDLRTETVAQQTRTHTIPIQGEDRAHQRHTTVPQQTRTVKTEGMQ